MSTTASLKIRLNGGNARSNSSLAPSVGQKSISLPEFVSQYDSLTSHYDSSLVLNVRVSVQGRKFIIKPGFISTSLGAKRILQYQTLGSRSQEGIFIGISDVYMLLLLKQKDPRVINLPASQILRIVLGTVRSLHIRYIGIYKK